MGKGSIQSTAVQGAIGWPESARRDAARPFRPPYATVSDSWWTGPTPVSRSCQEKLARGRGVASHDQHMITR